MRQFDAIIIGSGQGGTLIEGKQESIKDRMVPYTMFTDPQLGRVGITEQQARKD